MIVLIVTMNDDGEYSGNGLKLPKRPSRFNDALMVSRCEWDGKHRRSGNRWAVKNGIGYENTVAIDELVLRSGLLDH